MESSGGPVELWSLSVHGKTVRCVQARSGGRLELRALAGDEVLLSQVFDDGARLKAHAAQLRLTLESMAERSAEPGAEGPAALAGAEDAGGGREPLPATAADRAAMPGRPAVLVVDDEDAVRSFLRAYLEEAGYDVREATDVDSALGMLDHSRVDAVVLDVRMPDPRGLRRSGLEVLAFIRLHAAHATTPVLILTGRPLEAGELDVIRRHHADLFLKPDGYRKLLQRLEQLTGRDHDARP